MGDGQEAGQYYLQDELGSPIRLADEAGELTESYGYDEFGRPLYENQPLYGKGSQESIQPFGYTGYQYDEIAGTYYAQAREYRPKEGRFSAEDVIRGSITAPFTLNRYGYCWGNPVGLVDLNGKWPIWNDIKAAIQRGARKEVLLQELDGAVKSYINPLQVAKTASYNTNEEALKKVFRYDNIITEAAEEYGVDKAAVQAILFQEIRFYAIEDPAADALVKESYKYEQKKEEYEDWKDRIQQDGWKVLLYQIPSIPLPVIGYRLDSSTGLGQIFATTAIAAQNDYLGEKKYNSNDWKVLRDFWYQLQDPNYNIDMVAKVLLLKGWNKEGNMTTEDVQKVLEKYNGSGNLAEAYGEVAIQYYLAFKKYNCGLE